jgi:capsular polysaccharide transport system permease protein
MNDIDDPRATAIEGPRAVVRRRPALPAVDLRSGIRALRALAGRALLRRASKVEEIATDAELGARRRLAASPILVSFILCVLTPAAAGFVYFFVVASDQYTAEARFAVRAADDNSEKKPSVGNLLSPLLSSAGSFAHQDAEIVASYIRSRAIIDDLEGVIDVRAIFSRPEADFWERLPDNASAEVLRDHWSRKVSAYLEHVSGIVNVKVRAFRREDALALTKAILEVSERLVNSISLRARADAMRRAEEEVRRADGSMRLALADLASFRDTVGIIDPVKSADLVGKILLQLMLDKIKIETELFIVQRVSSVDAPGTASLRARLESVDGQIARTRAELTGENPQARNLASALARFEELEVKRQFAESVYAFARDGLDRARIAAERQTIYVTVFVPPALPQEVAYPLRLTFSLLIALGFAVTWGTGAMICASVMDHRL